MLKPALVIACAVSASLAACAGAAGVAGAFAPPPAPEAPTVGVARLAKGADGHYWARAAIDGGQLDLLVDTGATAVALTPADARALGLDPARLAYTRPMVTAAGRTRAAPVRLARVAIGAVEVRDVTAVVVPHGLEHSLLGMSFLDRLKGFSAEGATLTLRS